VSPDTKEITTLGRGGSDVTAVAMAAHFQADACEICKDVDGVYSADPKVVPAPFHRSDVTSQALLDMTFWGAKLLHYRSVELAVVHRVPLVIRLAHPNHAEERMTRMTQSQDHDKKGPTPTVVSEKPGVLSLNSLAEVRRISLTGAHPANALESLRLSLQDADLPLPQILNISPSESGWSILFSAPAESLSLQVERLRRTPSCVVDSANWCTVTATCQGLFSSALSEDLTVLLKDAGLSVSQVLFGAMSITWVLPQSQREMAIKTLHSSALCRPEAAEELDRAGLR
jgi:aspartate kinase